MGTVTNLANDLQLVNLDYTLETSGKDDIVHPGGTMIGSSKQIVKIRVRKSGLEADCYTSLKTTLETSGNKPSGCSSCSTVVDSIGIR